MPALCQLSWRMMMTTDFLSDAKYKPGRRNTMLPMDCRKRTGKFRLLIFLRAIFWIFLKNTAITLEWETHSWICSKRCKKNNSHRLCAKFEFEFRNFNCAACERASLESCPKWLWLRAYMVLKKKNIHFRREPLQRKCAEFPEMWTMIKLQKNADTGNFQGRHASVYPEWTVNYPLSTRLWVIPLG